MCRRLRVQVLADPWCYPNNEMKLTEIGGVVMWDWSKTTPFLEWLFGHNQDT